MKKDNCIELLDKLVNAIENNRDTKSIIREYYIQKNGYFTENKKTYLILTQGQVTLVNKKDLPRITKHSWFATKQGKDFYVRAKINGKSVPLHRFLMGCYDSSKIVDHKNNNTLDNRTSNLRIVNTTQSAINRRGWRNKGDGSKYKGVYKSGNKWRSVIKKKGKRFELGRFNTQEEAAKAYDKKAVELHGEFANLNF